MMTDVVDAVTVLFPHHLVLRRRPYSTHTHNECGFVFQRENTMRKFRQSDEHTHAQTHASYAQASYEFPNKQQKYPGYGFCVPSSSNTHTHTYSLGVADAIKVCLHTKLKRNALRAVNSVLPCCVAPKWLYGVVDGFIFNEMFSLCSLSLSLNIHTGDAIFDIFFYSIAFE